MTMIELGADTQMRRPSCVAPGGNGPDRGRRPGFYIPDHAVEQGSLTARPSDPWENTNTETDQWHTY